MLDLLATADPRLKRDHLQNYFMGLYNTRLFQRESKVQSSATVLTYVNPIWFVGLYTNDHIHMY